MSSMSPPRLASNHVEAVACSLEARDRRSIKQEERARRRCMQKEEVRVLVLASTFALLRDFAESKPRDRREARKHGRKRLKIQFYRMFQWWRASMVRIGAENVAAWVGISHYEMYQSHVCFLRWRNWGGGGYQSELYEWAAKKMVFGEQNLRWVKAPRANMLRCVVGTQTNLRMLIFAAGTA